MTGVLDDLDEVEDPARDAVFCESNYNRVDDDVRAALRRSGCILPDGVIQALTCTVLEESLSTRRRMTFIVRVFADAFEGDVTPQRMDRLEWVLLAHIRDQHNLAVLPPTADDH